MKPHDTIIQTLRDCLQDQPGEALQNRVFNSAMAGAAVSHPVKRKIRLKPLLVAATLVVVLASTAFAFSDEIRQFMFGTSKIEQVEGFCTVEFPLGQPVLRYTIQNGLYQLIPQRDEDMVEFSTVEELRQAAAFNVKEPNIPLNAELCNVIGWKYTEEKQLYAAHLYYNIIFNEADKFRERHTLSFRQYDAGPDAYFDVETVYPIQQVKIGKIEASLAWYQGEDSESMNLYWMKNGILYELGYYGLSPDREFGLDTLIAIAESVR
jgi:hypothetical protein